jgi:hypothetical protein
MTTDGDCHSGFSVSTLITILLTLNPSLSIDAIQSALNSVGLSPSRVLVAALRSSFFRHLELIDAAGLIDQVKPPKVKPSPLTHSPRDRDTGRADTRDRVHTMLQQNMKQKDIARQLGISGARVSQIASRWTREKS